MTASAGPERSRQASVPFPRAFLFHDALERHGAAQSDACGLDGADGQQGLDQTALHVQSAAPIQPAALDFAAPRGVLPPADRLGVDDVDVPIEEQ